MSRLNRSRLRQFIGLSAIVTVFVTPVLLSKPVQAQLQQMREAVAQNLQQEPQVQLTLSAAKQVVTTDSTGKTETTWQPLSGEVTVQPGDVLRYSLDGKNASDRPVRNLVLTQPIPEQMKYVLNSATGDRATSSEMTYSIDGGKTFVANPTVEVTLPDGTVETQPAPAEVYTHIRWSLSNAIGANASLNVAYQVEVR